MNRCAGTAAAAAAGLPLRRITLTLTGTVQLRRTSIIAACALLVASAQGAASGDLWERLTRFDFNGVADELAKDPALSSRDKRLVLAVALLNRQPRTPGGVADAARQLDTLVQEQPRDDVGRWGRFLLARIAQFHRVPVSPVEAARQYRELISDDLAHPAAQRSVTKLAVLLVYDPDVEPDRGKGFREAEALAKMVRDDATMAELRLMLGRAAVFLRMPPEIGAKHLQAAVKAGIATPFLRSATLFGLGELARESGNRNLALSSYRAFLEENARDQRARLVREHIAELERATAAR